jgi:flagellin-like hook-associated protein FlgL
MSTSITSIPASGISTQFVRNQLLNQLTVGQTRLYQLEMQVSTGHQFQLASENTSASIQVEGIQSLLQRKDQLKSNISSTQTYLNQTDSALTSISNLLTSVQSTALGAVGSTASAAQRQAAIEQIQQAVQELVRQGNQSIGGRQLFGGTNTASLPFSIDAAGNVVYSGSADSPQTYVDLNQLFSTSVTGDQAFGAMSDPVQGAALTPALSSDTPLTDLNSGRGVAAGSIAISDGHDTSVVDLRSAHTLGDVALLIEQHPPAGRTIRAEVSSTGLTIRLEPDPAYPTGDNLIIQEVNGNSTAQDLGILNTTGTGAGPIVGQPLSPNVVPSTSLDDLFGARSTAYIRFGQPNSDIILQADSPGAATASGTLLNGVTVQFVADAPAAGQESAAFAAGTPAAGNNPGTPGTLTVHISTSAVSASNASQIVSAINATAGLPFTARLDPADQDGGVPQPLTGLPATATTSGGSGTTLDTSGLQVVSEGKTYTIDVSGDQTVQDLLNSINGAGAGLDAEINAAKTGIDVRSRVSGSSFSIGENGGTTAAQLGLRTFNAATQLTQLNYGQGVGRNTATPGGSDFTISQTLPGAPPTTVQVDVSVAGDTTVGDVIQSINTAAQAAGATFHAQLARSGNGIELTDTDPTHGPIVVAANSQSAAAADLGLVPAGQTTSQSQVTGGQVVLTGSDVNPQETGSIFNALIKLAAAFRSNSDAGVQRAMGLLSTSMDRLNNSRAELGVREQSLTTISSLIDNEELNLKAAMSNVYDTDMASAVSQYTAAQTSYQATLQTTASLLKMTLLSYL